MPEHRTEHEHEPRSENLEVRTTGLLTVYFLLPPKTLDQNPRFFGCSGCCGAGGCCAGAASAVRCGGGGATDSCCGAAERPGAISAASALNGDEMIRRWIGHDSVGSVPATKYSVYTVDWLLVPP